MTAKARRSVPTEPEMPHRVNSVNTYRAFRQSARFSGPIRDNFRARELMAQHSHGGRPAGFGLSGFLV